MEYLRSKQAFGFVSQQVMRCPKLSHDAKVVYAYIATFAGPEQTAFPGRDLILAELHMGRTKYYRSMDELKENGVIEVGQFRDEGKFGHNLYTLNHLPCG